MKSTPLFALAFLMALPLAGIAVTQEELVEACTSGDLAKVQQFVKAGARVNETNGEGQSPLLCAIFSGKSDVVAFLLQKGADPNQIARCPESQCPSHPALVFAVYMGDRKIVKLLLDAKADPAWDDHQATRRANAGGDIEMFNLLKAAGGHEWQSAPADAAAALPPAGPSEPADTPVIGKILPGSNAMGGAPRERARLAIVADEPSQDASGFLAAELTQDALDLVERNDIKRILSEHHLGPEFVKDAAQASSLGLLLNADAVLFLQQRVVEQRTVLESRLVRVSPGLILDTTIRPWPPLQMQAWSAEAAARLRLSLWKLHDRKAIAFSPADIRPSIDRPIAAAAARDAALLFTDAFVRKSGIVVLERSALAALAQEQALGKTGDFWGGGYLVDGAMETAADNSGSFTLTLRLQPVKHETPLIFQAKGGRGGLHRAVADLAEQAAKAVALRGAPVEDLTAEAQRHLQAAQSAFQSKLYLQAYRQAQTAALLGLKAPDLVAWRFRCGLTLAHWQLLAVAEQNFDRLPMSGWSEAWMNWRLNGTDWVRPREWLELGRENISLWRSLMSDLIKEGDVKALEALLAPENNPAGSSLAIWRSVHTAVGQMTYPEELDALLLELREAYAGLLPELDRLPLLADAHDKLEESFLHQAPVLYPDSIALAGLLQRLLAEPRAKQSLAKKAKILGVIMGLGESSWQEMTARGPLATLTFRIATPQGPAAERILLAQLAVSQEPEDRLISELLRHHLAASPADRRVISDRLFHAVIDSEGFFMKNPETLSLLEVVCEAMRKQGPNAPLWAMENPRNGASMFSPKILAFRRRIFLEVMRHSAELRAGLGFFDSDYHPPDEDAIELKKLLSRPYALQPPNGGASAAGPTASPRPRPRKTGPKIPSYAAETPIVISRIWTVEKALPEADDDFQIHFHSTVAEGDHVWLYGQGYASNAGDCVIEIKLPTLAAQMWPLPADAPHTYGPARLLVDPEHVYIAKRMSFFAVGNRRARTWTLNPEIQPATGMVRAGADLYMLTGHAGDRGLLRYATQTGHAELLASNRRAKPETPLDDPTITATNLFINSEGAVAVELIGPATTNSGETASGRLRGAHSQVIYDPAAKTWQSLPFPPEEAKSPYSLAPPSAYHPMTQPGDPIACVVSSTPETVVLGLRLPSTDRPIAILPFRFQPLDNRPKQPSRPPMDWFWTPEGYLISGAPGPRKAFWFLPQKDVDDYLQTHQPVDDETYRPKSFTSSPDDL